MRLNSDSSATTATTISTQTDTSTISVTATSTSVILVTQTSTTSTTTTVIATSTPAAPQQSPQCDPNSLTGCSSNCQCDVSYDGANAGIGYCIVPVRGKGGCLNNAFCGAGNICDTSSNICYSYVGCTSTYSPSKRSLKDSLTSVRRGRISLRADSLRRM